MNILLMMKGRIRMKRILVRDLFLSAFSESKAIILKEEINECLKSEETIQIDFKGITKFTTLFFNFSTGAILASLGPIEYDKRIQLVGLSELGMSTYNSSYENAKIKYSPEKEAEILEIISNPKE